MSEVDVTVPGPSDGGQGGSDAPSTSPSGVQVVTGRLETEELAAIAVVVSAMSVTSRLEAEERTLAEGHSAGSGVWNDPVHCHPHSFAARTQSSPAAWQFSHR